MRTYRKRRYYIIEDTDKVTKTTKLKYYKKETSWIGGKIQWFYCDEWMIDLSDDALFEIDWETKALAIPIKIPNKQNGPALVNDTRYARFPEINITGLFDAISKEFESVGTRSSSFEKLKSDWEVQTSGTQLQQHDLIYVGPGDYGDETSTEWSGVRGEEPGNMFEPMILKKVK